MIYKSEKNTVNQNSKFYKFIAVFGIFMGILTVGTLSVLWFFLSEYEKSDPRYPVSHTVNLIEKNDFSLAAENLNTEYTEFFTEDYFISYLENTFGKNGDVKVIKTKSEDENSYGYTLEGKNGKISIKAVKQKETLAFNLPKYALYADLGPQESWKISAPDNMQVKVNGVVLDTSHLTKEKFIPLPYQTMNDKSLAPALSAYAAKGIYGTPEIEAEGGEISIDSTEKTVIISDKSKEIPKERKDNLTYCAVKYANYISKDAQLSDINQFLYKDTQFYSHMQNYSNFWYIDHEVAKAENIQVLNYQEYSPTAYSAEIKFDYRIYQKEWNINKIYPTHYRISFAQIDGIEKVINIETL